MIRLWLTLVALVLAQAIPGVLNAKTITVQSGEHAGFTRLVVYYKGTTGWSFGATDGGYALRPKKPGITYHLDRVYQLIPRDRIADISARPDGTLFLSVDCACHAEVSEHLGQVVVDVKDGAEPSAADGNGSAVYASAVPGVAHSKLNPGSEAFQGPPPSYRSRGSGLVWNDLDLSPPLAGSDMTPRMQIPDPSIAETRSALITQIARAASDGLVTPDLTVPVANISSPAQTPVEPDLAPIPVEEAALPAGPNIRIETAFERSELSKDPATPRNESGENCLPSSRFDLSAWGRPPEQGAAIASYRAGLVGEFDAANPESLAALARHYIYLTFGAEAQGLIRSFDGQIKDAPLLNMLAEIMDDGQSNAFPAIASQISCDSAPALWAILAKPKLTSASQISRTAVLSAFSSLPLHLRRHLGPVLANRFLQVGDTDTAATIRNSITRAPGAVSADVKMLKAGIALELGDHQQGVDQLSEVIDDNGPLVPTAVIALIEASLAAGETPDAKLVESARVLAFEARGSEEGAQLKLASLRARAHKGEIVEALEELSRATEPFNLPVSQVDALRREAIDLASRNGADAQFLQVLLGGPAPLGTDQASIAIRRRAAARLIDLDLFKEARDLLGEDPGVPAPEDRLLYAQSHIGEVRPDLALGYLAGLTDETAMTLRAKAHTLAQEFGRASALYADLGKTEESARAAWRGQNFEAVRQIGSEAEVAAAKLVLNAAAVGSESGIERITLAEGERVLQQSRESRQVLAALLSEIAQP